MKRVGITIFLLVSLYLLGVGPILAQKKTASPSPTKINLPLILAGKEETVSEKVDRDLVVTGGQVEINADIDGNVLVAGGQITVKGNVSQNLVVTGGNVTIDGKVGRNLVLIGGQLNINSEVTGEALVAGGQINLKGTIDQNLAVAGGSATISGNVSRNLVAATGELKTEEKSNVGGYVLAAGGLVKLGGRVNGPVKVWAETFNVVENSLINGDVEADVVKDNIATSASISGERKVTYHKSEIKKPKATVVAGTAAAGVIIFGIGKLILLMVLVKIFGKTLEPATTYFKSFWASLGVGLVALIVSPAAVFLMMITIVGIPLGLVTLVSMVMLMCLSDLVVAATLGSYLNQKGWLANKNAYIQSVVGLVLVVLIGLIPVIGGLAKLIFLILGMGIVLRMAWKK
jgi:hypothetical protein